MEIEKKRLANEQGQSRDTNSLNGDPPLLSFIFSTEHLSLVKTKLFYLQILGKDWQFTTIGLGKQSNFSSFKSSDKVFFSATELIKTFSYYFHYIQNTTATKKKDITNRFFSWIVISQPNTCFILLHYYYIILYQHTSIKTFPWASFCFTTEKKEKKTWMV